MRHIKIDPITRLEGHGKIDIFLNDDGEVANTYFQIPELRGFEQFCVGRPVEEMPRQTGEPTKNVITAIVTQNAIESDKAGMAAVFAEQKRLGMGKPEILYADAAYVSGPGMAQAQAESRELMGPAIASPDRGVYTSEAFYVDVERRYAICPSGKTSTQCARMKAGKTGRITYRFEWCGLCQNCAVKEACLHKGEREFRCLSVF
mgnify:CR=1 FL=1